MARYENRFIAGGVACTAGQANYVQTIVAPAGRPQWVEELELTTRSQNVQDLPMLVQLIEYANDGSTGTTNNSVALDARVTATPPAGKYGEAGTSTQIPNGAARELWRKEVPPQYPFRINLVDVLKAEGRVWGAGTTLAVVVTPNTAGQTVFPTIRHSD